MDRHTDRSTVLGGHHNTYSYQFTLIVISNFSAIVQTDGHTQMNKQHRTQHPASVTCRRINETLWPKCSVGDDINRMIYKSQFKSFPTTYDFDLNQFSSHNS